MMRPEALVEIRGAFELLEMTLLADGRDWILKTENPSLADIEGMFSLGPCLPHGSGGRRLG